MTYEVSRKEEQERRAFHSLYFQSVNTMFTGLVRCLWCIYYLTLMIRRSNIWERFQPLSLTAVVAR